MSTVVFEGTPCHVTPYLDFLAHESSGIRNPMGRWVKTPHIPSGYLNIAMENDPFIDDFPS